MSIEQRLAAAERLKGFIADGAVIQHSWRGERDGRETACLLAALHPVTSSAACPAWLLPQWVAHLLPAIDDGIAKDRVLPIAQALYDRTPIWSALDADGWKRVRFRFLASTVQQALDSARAAQPTPAPEYWQQVVDAVEPIIASLKAGQQPAAEAKAAAEAAAWSAKAAAAEAAAWSAAWSAKAAAEAAAWSAKAAWNNIAEAFFAALDAETAS